MKPFISLLCTALGVAAMSCAETDAPADSTAKPNNIVATLSNPQESRTAVDGDPVDGVVGLLWTDGDQLGVFDAQGANHTLYQKEGAGPAAKATFYAAQGNITPHFAYYPYSAENAGRSITSLAGAIPAEQAIGDGLIEGDYKYGQAKGSTSQGYDFEFSHMFSLVKVEIDAAGSYLQGEALKKVELIASRLGAPVALAGGFTFNAGTGSYSISNDAASALTMSWLEAPALTQVLTGHVSMFPTVRIGDKLTFKVYTDKHIATFTATAKIDFRREGIYLFSLTLTRFEASEYDYTLTDPEGNAIDLPDLPASKKGTFTCATLNVNGLRTSGSSTGERITADGWDFFSVSEDFSHSSFVSGLSDYDCGEAPGNSLSRTDGIVLFWKKDGFNATGETRVKYDSSYGNIFNGADETKDKGFRYYLLTLADGTEIDVYITHMNSGSDTGHLNARKDQLQQLAEYIIAHNNGRPIIFMGDTNCRYTRDYVKSLLIDPLAQAGLVGNDPWVDFQWNGVWPACPSSSIMVGASSGKATIDGVEYSDDDNGGAGYGYQKGEVVDKIIYFNQSEAKVKLKALSYLHDETYGNLSDHWPIVVEFEYTTEK